MEKIKGKEEREKERKSKLVKSIIYVIVLAVVVYIFLYLVLIRGGYERDESLNVSYDLYHDIIPDPIQVSVPKETFKVNVRGIDIDITKLAKYDITGKVEAIQDYNTNAIASILSFKGENVIDYISPIDITLSWGEIALMENSNHIVCDQYYLNKARGVWPVWDSYLTDKYSDKYVLTHISNNHLISLDSGIRNEFKKVKVGQVIRFQGYLVDVKCSNGKRFGPSSLIRDDYGCEIIYIDKFLIMK